MDIVQTIDYTRVMDIIPPMATTGARVALVGTGGIGAATALALGKLGIGYLEMYDPDTVDPENIPTQLLRVSDVGKPKVQSVVEILRQMAEIHGKAVPEAVDATHLFQTDIVISALDSISARQAVWQAAESSPTVDWYLDARMGAEVFQLYVVRPIQQEGAEYNEVLLSLTDDMVPDEPCTAKATIYCAFVAAGLIAHAVKLVLMGQPVPTFQQFDIKHFSYMTPGRMV